MIGITAGSPALTSAFSGSGSGCASRLALIASNAAFAVACCFAVAPETVEAVSIFDGPGPGSFAGVGFAGLGGPDGPDSGRIPKLA